MRRLESDQSSSFVVVGLISTLSSASKALLGSLEFWVATVDIARIGEARKIIAKCY
jgi:hypothetical protein